MDYRAKPLRIILFDDPGAITLNITQLPNGQQKVPGEQHSLPKTLDAKDLTKPSIRSKGFTTKWSSVRLKSKEDRTTYVTHHDKLAI